LRRKIIWWQILLSLLLLVGITGSASLAAAEKNQTWVVRSEYQSPIPGKEKSTIWWQFERQILVNGEARVVVTDLEGRVQSRAELYYDLNDALAQADCYRQRRGEELVDARVYDVTVPVIINQSLVPGDWLNREQPFAARKKADEYLIKEQIGTTVFSSRILVTEESVSYSEALAAGMIGSDNQGLVQGKTLRLVTVSKLMRTEAELSPLMRQLWAVGDSFWLYEEKAGRRSWRCQRQ